MPKDCRVTTMKEKACVPVKWSLKDEKIPQDIWRSLAIEDVQIIMNFRQIRNIFFRISIFQIFHATYLVARMVKNLPANSGDEDSIPSLGRSPGGGNGTHSSIPAWKIPWTEEPGWLESMESQRVRHDWNDLVHVICTSYSPFPYS